MRTRGRKPLNHRGLRTFSHVHCATIAPIDPLACSEPGRWTLAARMLAPGRGAHDRGRWSDCAGCTGWVNFDGWTDRAGNTDFRRPFDARWSSAACPPASRGRLTELADLNDGAGRLGQPAVLHGCMAARSRAPSSGRTAPAAAGSGVVGQITRRRGAAGVARLDRDFSWAGFARRSTASSRDGRSPCESVVHDRLMSAQ